jgi:VWFA-related protein
VAFYSYSRNFSRACLLTPDRSQVIHSIRATVAGDNAALYNSLLMTLQDAARLSGRKVVVVFSNGPDNASAVGPEDIREMAQTEGIPIYMISTQEARLDPLSTAIFERVSATTGGKVYFAKNWKEEEDAFVSIRDDLAHLYFLSYYPQPNPNRGWRSITVKLVGENLKSYHVRTRTGYRPKAVRLIEQIKPAT